MTTTLPEDELSKKIEELQAQLEHSNRFLNDILDHIPDRIFIKDEHHRYVLLNDAFCSYVGRSREELIGKSDADIHLKSEKNYIREKDNLVLNTGRSNVNAETYVNAGGDMRNVITQKTLLVDSTGVKYLVGIAYDINEHKKAEDDLKDKIWQRRILLDQSLDGLAIIDNDGNVVDANQKFAEMLGYPLGDLLRLRVWDFDGLCKKEEFLEDMRIYEGAGGHVIRSNRRRDGSMIEMELSYNGAVFGERKLIFCVSRDITERKHAERERDKLIRELQNALSEVKTLSGLLPICASCKKIRDDKGYWNQIESYIHEHSNAEFSHGICPDCAKKLYPELFE